MRCQFGLMAVLMTAFAGVCGDLQVAKDGQAACRIVLPDAPANDVRFAASDLKTHLEKATGAVFVLDEGATADGRPAIEVGTARAKAKALAAAGTLADGESAVVCDGSSLWIWGEGQYGTPNGVYVFLERRLECRWLTPWDEPDVPKVSDLCLPPFTLVYRPRLKARWLLTAIDSATLVRNGGLFLYRNRASMDDRPGFGAVDLPKGCRTLARDSYSVPPSVHTMFRYLPPTARNGQKGLFKDHPDWFSMNRKGVRTDKMQVCFSSPDARRAFADSFLAHVAKHGGKGYFNLSQTDDDEDGFCHCPACEALVKEFGTPGAPFYGFLKDLGQELAQRHPEARITFLCYRKSQTQYVPNDAFGRFPDNLVPIFAPIDDDFSKDFAHANNVATFEDFRRWRAISRETWTWYYPQPYGGKGAPAGGIGRWVADLRKMADSGLSGAMFEHDVGYPLGLGTVDLQAWMMLKCYEDPGQDAETLMRDFCTHYYGPAADEIVAFAQDLDRIAETCPRRLAWNDWYPETVEPKTLMRWQTRFDAAERKVGGNALLLQRLRECRSGIDLHALKSYGPMARSGYATSADALYRRITNTLERAYFRRAEASQRDPSWCQPRKLFERMASNAAGWFQVASLAGKPLPVPLEKIRADEAVQILAGTSTGGKAVRVDDAFGGVAVWNEKDSGWKPPFECGYYDQVAKRVVAARKFDGKEVVPDRFHLYRVGMIRLAKLGLVYLGGSWQCTQDMKGYYDPEAADRDWELWVSYKFEGPRFAGSAAGENRVLCDRVILVPGHLADGSSL